MSICLYAACRKIQCMQLFINDKTLWCSIRFCFPFSFSTSNIMRWENIWSAPRSETNSRTSQHCVCIPKLADCTKSILFICHVVLRCHESNERHQIGMRKSIWNDWVWCRLVWTSGIRRRWPHHQWMLPLDTNNIFSRFHTSRIFNWRDISFDKNIYIFSVWSMNDFWSKKPKQTKDLSSCKKMSPQIL